jgi:hypothetical protein
MPVHDIMTSTIFGACMYQCTRKYGLTKMRIALGHGVVFLSAFQKLQWQSWIHKSDSAGNWASVDTLAMLQFANSARWHPCLSISLAPWGCLTRLDGGKRPLADSPTVPDSWGFRLPDLPYFIPIPSTHDPILSLLPFSRCARAVGLTILPVPRLAILCRE